MCVYPYALTGPRSHVRPQERCAAMPEDSNCHVNVGPNGLYGQRCGSNSVKLPADWTRNDAAQWIRYTKHKRQNFFYVTRTGV